MRKILNALFFVLIPWPLYILLSYHYLRSGVREIVPWAVIIGGILTGLCACVWNFTDSKNSGKKSKYNIVFTIIYALYLLWVIIINMF